MYVWSGTGMHRSEPAFHAGSWELVGMLGIQDTQGA